MYNKRRYGEGEAEGFSPIEDCGGSYYGGGDIIGDGSSNGRSFLQGNLTGKNSGPWIMGYCASNGVSR